MSVLLKYILIIYEAQVKKCLAPEHVLRKIHDCTFRPKDFLPDFFDPNSPENSPLIFPFHPSKMLMTIFSPHPIFITAKTLFHHCTFSFLTAHFVHRCTLKHASLPLWR